MFAPYQGQHCENTDYGGVVLSSDHSPAAGASGLFFGITIKHIQQKTRDPHRENAGLVDFFELLEMNFSARAGIEPD